MAAENVIVVDHPVIQTKLTELRDFATEPRKFRALLNEIASLMVYEVTRDWPTKPRPIQTPSCSPGVAHSWSSVSADQGTARPP